RRSARLDARRCTRVRERGHAGPESRSPTAVHRSRLHAPRRSIVVPQVVRVLSEWSIPFNRPTLTGTEFEYMAEAVAAGPISGDGAFPRRCETLLAQELGAERVLLTTSCTHALELAALVLEISPGDEVIVPSFTFVSTASAFALRGARIIF